MVRALRPALRWEGGMFDAVTADVGRFYVYVSVGTDGKFRAHVKHSDMKDAMVHAHNRRLDVALDKCLDAVVKHGLDVAKLIEGLERPNV